MASKTRKQDAKARIRRKGERPGELGERGYMPRWDKLMEDYALGQSVPGGTRKEGPRKKGEINNLTSKSKYG